MQADPGLAAGIGALLGALELHGLIEQPPVRGAFPPRGPSNEQMFYLITDAGRAFLSRLADEPEASEAVLVRFRTCHSSRPW